ncbi:TetR/AcrR family transcriptional regulator [Motilibacter aurantiacus]|uniref:TetR/AcrR family transcriptional regulator n=1 Tax=Motilibacter aurantiacus TaxID=2714955 RepID=UPI001409EE98|nr:TetR/AcrR family transcriptional regulator [Motilibacter aurantiacus]NHC43969.1 TetR/AcrR family transcriptional regulator [Motilibacter aurantiacus]
MSTRREITRAATVDEIKRTALGLMREQGSTDLRFADIARAMSMTAPGLYRYFANRNELVAALVEDAFVELGDALEQAIDDTAGGSATARLYALCQAYRSWATADPTRFAVVFGLPVAGYVPKDQENKSAAVERAFSYLASPVLAAVQAGEEILPGQVEVAAAFAAVCNEPPLDGLSPAQAQAVLHAWASLHGFVSLEAFGHLFGLAGEPADALFTSLVRAVAVYIGLPPA